MWRDWTMRVGMVTWWKRNKIWQTKKKLRQCYCFCIQGLYSLCMYRCCSTFCAWCCRALHISTAVSQLSFISDDLIVYITSIHHFFFSSSLPLISLTSFLFSLTPAPTISVPRFFFIYLFLLTIAATVDGYYTRHTHYGPMSFGTALNSLSSYCYPCCCY